MAMTLRLSESDEQLLMALAESAGVSKQEATVRAIREAAERRDLDVAVAEASARVRSRYAKLLERLGQ